MSKNIDKDLVYCLRILESIGKIIIYSNDYDEPFVFFVANDQREFNASLLLLLNIGEQSNRISDEMKKKHSQISWKKIKDFRNIVAHDYVNVDKFIVFKVIKEELSILKNAIEELIKEEVLANVFDNKEYQLSKESNYYKHIDFGNIL